MKIYTKIACCVVWCALLVGSASAQQKQSSAQERLLRAQYGENFEEVLDKHGDNSAALMRMQMNELSGANAPTDADAFRSIAGADLDDIGRSEAEPNNFFDTADNINDVLALAGRLDEYNGKLIQAELTADDVDVYRFTVDTTKMYYFASTHSFLSDGSDGLDVRMRLFHESDLDTTLVTADQGIEGNDKLRGDILGRNTDGRNGSNDFRLTGWTSPIDPATGAQLTGDFYLWVFNDEGATGTYFMTAYQIDFEPWVSRAEPNQSFQEALLNPASVIPTDAVVRTYMNFNPDTIKVVTPEVPVQSNSVYPLLLAQGDEDVDLYRIDYKAGHTLTVETLPYFGWYRENDGTIGPGGSRLTDPRIRIYDADFTQILAEDDDAGRERMDGPNNIHSRLVLDSEFFASNSITEDTPLWLWVSAWASSTRTRTDPGDGGVRSVDNRDPGRFMYDIYATMVNETAAEVEPNNTTAEATSATAGSQAVYTGSFSDAADEDYFRVFMHEVRMYTLFTNSTVGSEIGIEIYREEEVDSDGTLALTENLLDASAVTRMGNDFMITGFIPEESGAYLIKLTSGSAGDYELGLLDKGEIYFGRIANEPDDTAPDALSQEAMEVGPGAQAETAMIFPAGDVDHYFFSVGDGFELSLSLSGTSADLVSDFDGQMTLFDVDFNEIASDPAAIGQTLAAGTYVVRVESDDIGFYSLSGGIPFEESEPNESFADANLIALGQIYNAELTSGDVDFYEFTLEAGNLYSFRSLDNETGGEMTVGFYDEIDGATLLDDSGWPDNYGGANFKIANIIPRETGQYYLSVAGGTGAYKLISRVNEDYLALQSKGEPNNSMAEADAQGNYQSFGADVMYALADPSHPRFFGDEDWFRVELTSGQTLRAETKPVGQIVNEDEGFWARDTDTRIIIMDADGNELANDDDGGNDWYSSAGYVATSDQVVYVGVLTSRTPDAADDRSLNRGDYFLNISVTQDELEPNNTVATANPLASGFIQSSFAEDDSLDVYSLSLEADHIYHVRTLRPEEGGYGGPFSASLALASAPDVNLLSEENTGYNTRYSGDNVKLNIIPVETAEYILTLSGSPEEGMYYVGVKGRDISELRTLGEPNNTIEEADAIGIQEFDGPGETNTYMLYNADFAFGEGDEISTRFGDDVDMYKYDVVAGDTLIAETSPVDGPTWPRDYDGYMELYDAAGNLIDDNDDGGFDWHSRIEYIADAAQSVYVLVRSQDFEGATDRDPSRGEYNLSVTKLDGSPVTIPVSNEDLETPIKFALEQNYPNPFNPTTTIAYSIPQASDVELTVYNVLGQRVATVVSAYQTSGSYQVNFDASRLSSGVYLYRIKAGSHVSVKKMLLVK